MTKKIGWKVRDFELETLKKVVEKLKTWGLDEALDMVRKTLDPRFVRIMVVVYAGRGVLSNSNENWNVEKVLL